MRGFQVYQQVCSACHSIEQIAFRNLIGESHTEVASYPGPFSGCESRMDSRRKGLGTRL